MQLNSKVYDRLKFFALIVLPAFAAFYLGLGQVWEWPRTEEIVTSIALFDAFIGAILQISNHKYKNDSSRIDGFLTASGVDEDTGIPNLRLVVTTPPNELLVGHTALLKIGEPPSDI